MASQRAALEPTPFLKRVLCYPLFDDTTFQARMDELKQLGVESIVEMGNGRLDGYRILGKGCVSIVVAAQKDSETLALKIRRIDADRENMRRESMLLAKANRLGVGPQLKAQGDDFLLMELVDGDLLPRWLNSVNDRRTLQRTLMDLLQQCLALDLGGVDHGELSRAHKQVIVRRRDNKPFIVDFESASEIRRPSNLNATAQYIFIRTPVLKARMRELLGPWDEARLLEALRQYKKSPSAEGMSRVAGVLRLEPS